jgi:hypothetical protein
VVKTIINHPQITIFIGGINHQTWGGLLLFWPHHFITVTFVEQLTDLYTAKTRAMRWSPGILVPHTDKTPGFVWQTCYFYRAGPPLFGSLEKNDSVKMLPQTRQQRNLECGDFSEVWDWWPQRRGYVSAARVGMLRSP